jgi:Xaa-Pro aminopeptidase
MNITNRVTKLRRSIAEKELDGILISQAENRYYLSGFGGSAGYLLITHKETVLSTDFRYYEQVKVQAPDYRLFQQTGPALEWFPRLLDGLNIKRLGFEAGDVTFNLYKLLSDAIGKAKLPVQLIPSENTVEAVRSVKEPDEIKLISRAAEITDKAFKHIEEFIQPGMTELQVAWEMEKFQRELGSQAMPFDIIIASGPEAALPHHKASERKINLDEPIVIDVGAKIEGYASDFTRTLCLGQASDKFKKIYDTVLGAQLAAISLIKEGITGAEADGYARTVITEAGYGEYFGHSLGHGVGLAEHEMPRVGPNSTDILTSGMVFSVEPGIYLPGWGGVRIEDLAVLENGKVRLLSKGRK